MDPMEAIVKRPHAVCVPFPAQGHINPMMNLAKLLHQKGFHITFVNTHFNHNRLLRSRGPDSLNALPSFRFMSIPDGLPPSDDNSTQNIGALVNSTTEHCLAPLQDLIFELNTDSTIPPVTCIVSDLIMSFTLDAAHHFGIPNALFWIASACSLIAFLSFSHLIEKELIPIRDINCLTNGYLDTFVEGIPGLKGMRLKNFPPFIRIMDGDNFLKVPSGIKIMERGRNASAIILNTFDDLEDEIIIDALSSILHPNIFAIGPAHQLVDKITDKTLSSIRSNLWKEDADCLQWLDSKEHSSVIYVNFGSIAVMTTEQLVELAWGLADSNKNFLWVIRHDLVKGEDAIVPPEFVTKTKERGFITSWCPQEQVLRHPSIAGFLTHCGWNSTMESIGVGVPMICCPFSSDQPTNSWYCCNKLGIGIEVDGEVLRDKVEKLVVELMDTERGKEIKIKAVELKRKAEEAVCPGGSSQLSLDKLIKEVLL